jgi:hypothetical protein
MASRTLNRRELRKQAEAAEAAEPETAPAKAPAKKKARKTPTPRKSRQKVPPRMRARWGIFDGGMKQVAVFDYNQRAAAEEKLAALMEKKGPYFLQIVKEPMPEPAEADE